VNTEQLLSEADRCVKCGLCLPHCPTYRLTRDEGDSPRGRIALIQAQFSGRLEGPRLTRHLERCLGCRACEAACPSGVRYGMLIDSARSLKPGASRIGRLALLKAVSNLHLVKWNHWLVRLYQRSGLRRLMRLTGGRGVRRLDDLLPVLPAPAVWKSIYPARGHSRGRVGLFIGCISRVTDRNALDAAIRVFNMMGIDVVIPATQVCCGALHRHNGDPRTAANLAETNRQAFGGQPLDAIVYLASGCGIQLADYQHLGGALTAPVQEICHYLRSLGLTDGVVFSPSGQRVSLHTPCSLRYPLKGGDAARELLQLIPEIKLQILPDSGCCGAAGSYLLTQPEMADSLRQSTLGEVAAEKADILLTSNTGCAMHLAAGLRQAGAATEVLHPIELIARQLEPTN